MRMGRHTLILYIEKEDKHVFSAFKSERFYHNQTFLVCPNISKWQLTAVTASDYVLNS